MTKKLLVAIAALAITAGSASATTDAPARYRKVSGPQGMPDRFVLRHCGDGAEDSMARLQVVEFTPERVVYRCWQV